MSYSFSVVAKTKEEARAQIEQKLASVVEGQAVHKADKEAAQAVADAFVGLLADPSETENVHVSVSGSLGWREENTFTSANVSISASIQKQA